MSQQIPTSLYESLSNMKKVHAELRKNVEELQEVKDEVQTLLRHSIASGINYTEDLLSLIDRFTEIDDSRNKIMYLIIDEQAAVNDAVYEIVKEAHETN